MQAFSAGPKLSVSFRSQYGPGIDFRKVDKFAMVDHS